MEVHKVILYNASGIDSVYFFDKKSDDTNKTNIARPQKATQKTSHPLLRCQVVLTKRLLVRN